jgi:hypothetical protein
MTLTLSRDTGRSLSTMREDCILPALDFRRQCHISPNPQTTYVSSTLETLSSISVTQKLARS